MDHQASPPRPHELLMLGLSIYVLAALAADVFLDLSSPTRTLLGYMDFGICMVFLAEFFVNLARAKDRAAFLKWGWIDLVSSIPMLDVARVGRVARIARVLRMMRAVRSIRRIGTFLLQRRAEAALSAAAFIALLMVTFAGIVILDVEAGRAEANIRTAGDALWWAMTTITTVGYGDRYPVTPEGRVVAAMLMTVGVGCFGVFTGLVASWFLAPASGSADELARIRGQLDAVMRTLDGIRAPESALRPVASGEGHPHPAPECAVHSAGHAGPDPDRFPERIGPWEP